MDDLLELADGTGEWTAPADGGPDSIDTLDADALINLALGGSAPGDPTEDV